MSDHSYSQEGTRSDQRPGIFIRALWAARLESRWLVSRRGSTLKLLSLDPRINVQRIVDESKDLCIEGSPRSANTYSLECVWDANPEVKIARHVHLPGQVLEAVRLGIPTGVLLRNPVDAVVSRIAFSSGTISPKRFMRHWIRFYQPMPELVERRKVVLLPFDRVVADPAFPVVALNEAFGLELSRPRSSTDHLFARGGNRPSRKIWVSPEDRDRVVEKVAALELTGRAQALYDELLSMSERTTTASPAGSSS